MKANYLFFHMLSIFYQKFHSLVMKNASLHIYVLRSIYNIVSVCIGPRHLNDNILLLTIVRNVLSSLND